VRLFLGLLALLGLFTGAILLQRHFVLGAEPDRVPPGSPTPGALAYGSDWGRIVVGNPSGAAPYEPSAAAAHAPVPAAPKEREVPRPGGTATPASREFQLVVQRGQTLSGICQGHYKTARKEVVEAVARHNRIDRVAEIREGQKLSLPPLDSLLDR
jgi:nucleoid-associated protein YgaU